MALLQGGQVITAQSFTPGPTFAAGTLVVTLTEGEVARITNYNDLRVRVVAGRLTVPCCPAALPPLLNGTFTDKSGVFSALPDTIKLLYGIGWHWVWDGPGAVCQHHAELTLSCDGSGGAGFRLSSGATVIGPTSQAPDASPAPACGPLSLTFTVSGTFGCGAGGYKLTVTE